MANNRRDKFERQTAVGTHTVAALTGATATPGVMQALIDQELAGEREQERKHPRRPTEVRRARRRFHITFSADGADIPDRLRDLARQWELHTGSGAPAVSQVVEYLLLPQLRKAEAGEIAAPPRNRDDRSKKAADGVQWFD